MSEEYEQRCIALRDHALEQYAAAEGDVGWQAIWMSKAVYWDIEISLEKVIQASMQEYVERECPQQEESKPSKL